jgi:hypothetical protein
MVRQVSLRNPGIAIALALALGAPWAVALSADVAGKAAVVVRSGSPGRRGQGMGDGRVLILEPNPLVLGRDQTERVTMSVEPGLAAPSRTIGITFVPRSPFSSAAATGASETPLALGPLADGAEVGRYPYTISIQDETGAVIGEARGTVEVCETRSFPRPALIGAAVVAFLFLVANYAERRPLTRSYESQH